MAFLDLIPGLPYDVALECFIRVPIDQFYKFASTCKAWRCATEQKDFWKLRKMSRKTSPIIVIAQAKVDSLELSRDTKELSRTFSKPVYQLTVCDPERNLWHELPPVPGFPNGLPMFCQVVGVGLDVVVIGGFEPVSWKVLDSVFIFNFLSGTWRRGADMPGGSRSFFGCASGSGRVLVAGGHDGDKNALKSALMYDVAENEWVELPDMASQRDECLCVFHRGKFVVLGGYQTESQGRFDGNAEIFDSESGQWCQQQGFFTGSNCNCMESGDGRLYTCHNGDVVALDGDMDSWKVVTRLPVEAADVAHLATWHDKLFVIGSEKYGGPHRSAYVLDMNDKKSWIKLQIPDRFSGHVQSGCCLII